MSNSILRNPAWPGRRRAGRRRRTTWVERGRLLLILLLATLTLAAWAVTIYQAQTMDMPMGIVARGGAGPDTTSGAMDGMAMEQPEAGGMETTAASGMAGMAVAGWTWDGFAAFVVAWAVMMAAMMFPAATPMLLLYHGVATRRQARGGGLIPTWMFAAGYLLVWVGIGAVTWVLVEAGSDLAGRLGSAARATWGPIALGAVLAAAGFYQLTPLKRVCLDHCRTPLGLVTHHWRDGHLGALRMGIVHGGYCLGCCWALFAVLVATGVMSLAWMLLLTLVVFAEKVLPVGRWGAHAVGVAFLLLGGLVAAGATGLPWMV